MAYMEVNDRQIQTMYGEYQTLDQSQQQELKEWVIKNIKPYLTKDGAINHFDNSRVISNAATRDLGHYVSNLDLKIAMAHARIPRLEGVASVDEVYAIENYVLNPQRDVIKRLNTPMEELMNDLI